ncbi:universal stress protein [uncultured Sunxiuqinia sp.]|uniref:universal stress protein n=1 Tax=uncultured Sunxiuqinia sp. TaxID=1573825 RepID=UPI00260D208F|nr:universal stress protein [uncultured Sunxiuqinia sp.]
MEKLDNILVCMDLTEMDDFLINYASYLVEQTNAQKIYFLHLLQSYDLPREILSEFPDLKQPISKVIQEELEEKLATAFPHHNEIITEAVVLEGIKSDNLLQFTRDKKINLTLFGKKVGYFGRGSLARRVMPLTPSSVVLVSETAVAKIDTILVRIDFSKMSEIAMRTAVGLSKHTGARIMALHAYKIPISHFPNYAPEDEKRLQVKMSKHGEKEYVKFMKRLNLDPQAIPCSFQYDKNYDEAQLLYHYGLMNQADLIMIGSKIKSDLANVILDRTSEDLAEVEKNIPVMIVKDRKQTLGFLEALFD